MLILIAAFGNSLGYLTLARCVAMGSIPNAISHVEVTFHASRRDRVWGRRRTNSVRNAVVLVLMITTVAIWITRVQSQTNAPANSPTSPEFYLTRGEESSDARQYDRAIA